MARTLRQGSPPSKTNWYKHMDKRSDLRKHFNDQANQAELVRAVSDLSDRISSSEETTANAFKTLLDLIDGKITKTEVINQLDSISTPDVSKVVQAIIDTNKDKLTAKDLKGLEMALNKATRELSLIPKTQAKFEQRDTFKVSNLQEIKPDNSDIIKAIEKLDLKPQVDVKAPIVKVEKTDLKPLEDLTRDVLKATEANKPLPTPDFPEIPTTDLSKLEKDSKQAVKYLKEISEQRVSGGGGGGNGTPYIDEGGKLSNVVLVDGRIPVATYSEKPTVTYTWNGEELSQKVEVYSDRTETTDYTWDTGKLTNKVTTIS